MSIKKLLEKISIQEVPLHQAMGFPQPNDTTNKVFREIKASNRDIFWLISLARDIRKWRFIHVCSVCRQFKSGDEWVKPIQKAVWHGGEIVSFDLVYPQGTQSHTFCPTCYNKYYKDEIKNGILTAI
jgi:hypothetical protein